MERIIQELTKIYFTKNEAAIYANLLKTPGQTVYQLAKNLNMSRSSLYPVIKKMYDEGMVVLLNSTSQTYYPEKPSVLLKHLKAKYDKQIQTLEEELHQFEQFSSEEQFINIKNEDANIRKMFELLSNAKEEVYLNTDLAISFFDDIFTTLEKKNVKVIFFSFNEAACDKSNVEVFSKGFPLTHPTRIMLVVDLKEVLVVSINQQEWFGTYTNNQLMVNIVSEHIHHDIYLNKLGTKYGQGMLRRDNIYIDSAFERLHHVTKIK